MCSSPVASTLRLARVERLAKSDSFNSMLSQSSHQADRLMLPAVPAFALAAHLSSAQHVSASQVPLLAPNDESSDGPRSAVRRHRSSLRRARTFSHKDTHHQSASAWAGTRVLAPHAPPSVSELATISESPEVQAIQVEEGSNSNKDDPNASLLALDFSMLTKDIGDSVADAAERNGPSWSGSPGVALLPGELRRCMSHTQVPPHSAHTAPARDDNPASLLLRRMRRSAGVEAAAALQALLPLQDEAMAAAARPLSLAVPQHSASSNLCGSGSAPSSTDLVSDGLDGGGGAGEEGGQGSPRGRGQQRVGWSRMARSRSLADCGGDMDQPSVVRRMRSSLSRSGSRSQLLGGGSDTDLTGVPKRMRSSLSRSASRSQLSAGVVEGEGPRLARSGSRSLSVATQPPSGPEPDVRVRLVVEYADPAADAAAAVLNAGLRSTVSPEPPPIPNNNLSPVTSSKPATTCNVAPTAASLPVTVPAVEDDPGDSSSGWTSGQSFAAWGRNASLKRITSRGSVRHTPTRNRSRFWLRNASPSIDQGHMAAMAAAKQVLLEGVQGVASLDSPGSPGGVRHAQLYRPIAAPDHSLARVSSSGTEVMSLAGEGISAAPGGDAVMESDPLRTIAALLSIIVASEAGDAAAHAALSCMHSDAVTAGKELLTATHQAVGCSEDLTLFCVNLRDPASGTVALPPLLLSALHSTADRPHRLGSGGGGWGVAANTPMPPTTCAPQPGTELVGTRSPSNAHPSAPSTYVARSQAINRNPHVGMGDRASGGGSWDPRVRLGTGTGVSIGPRAGSGAALAPRPASPGHLTLSSLLSETNVLLGALMCSQSGTKLLGRCGSCSGVVSPVRGSRADLQHPWEGDSSTPLRTSASANALFRIEEHRVGTPSRMRPSGANTPSDERLCGDLLSSLITSTSVWQTGASLFDTGGMPAGAAAHESNGPCRTSANCRRDRDPDSMSLMEAAAAVAVVRMWPHNHLIMTGVGVPCCGLQCIALS